MEKGSAALKASDTKNVKPKVVGGVSRRSKDIKKVAAVGIAGRIVKEFANKRSVAKKSTARILVGGLPTPGGDKKSEL